MSIIGNTLKLTYGVIEDANVVKYLTGRENPTVLLDNALADVIARSHDWFRFVWIVGDQLKVYECEKGWFTLNLNDTIDNANKDTKAANEFVVHVTNNTECEENVEDFVKAVRAGKIIKIARHSTSGVSNRHEKYDICSATSYSEGSSIMSCRAEGSLVEIDGIPGDYEVVCTYYGVYVNNGALTYWNRSVNVALA